MGLIENDTSSTGFSPWGTESCKHYKGTSSTCPPNTSIQCSVSPFSATALCQTFPTLCGPGLSFPSSRKCLMPSKSYITHLLVSLHFWETVECLRCRGDLTVSGVTNSAAALCRLRIAALAARSIYRKIDIYVITKLKKQTKIAKV